VNASEPLVGPMIGIGGMPIRTLAIRESGFGVREEQIPKP
jgi:hypothetical protein